MEPTTKVSATVKQNVGIIELVGDVTSQAEESITQSFEKLEKEGLKKFLLKFNEATYINSSGLAIIITLAAETRKKRQKIGVSGLSNHFKKVFDMIGLTDYIDIYAGEADALKKL